MQLSVSRCVTAALLAGATLAAACTGSTSPAELTDQAAQLTQAEQDALVDELAFDPRFVSYMKLVFEVDGAMTAHVHDLGPAARAEALAEANDIVADGHQSGASGPILAQRVQALTGVTTAQLQDLRTRAAALRAAFPQLAQTGPALFGQAVEANPELEVLIVGTIIVDEPDEDDIADCVGDCTDDYVAAHNRAVLDLALDLVGCALSGNPLSIIICTAVAMGECTVKELIALNTLDNCEDGCFGIPPQGVCDSDVDCLASQWCDTGTLGLGDNSCRPDKAIGEVCSRDAKCASGCCKFDFFQNPVSMTCNPASDCN